MAEQAEISLRGPVGTREGETFYVLDFVIPGQYEIPIAWSDANPHWFCDTQTSSLRLGTTIVFEVNIQADYAERPYMMLNSRFGENAENAVLSNYPVPFAIFEKIVNTMAKFIEERKLSANWQWQKNQLLMYCSSLHSLVQRHRPYSPN